MWLGWILCSAFLLSLYDLGKKASVRDNAVFPSLLGSTLTGWLTVSVFLLCRGGFAATVAVSPATAALLLAKSCLVGASWTCTYLALRTLPITSAAPIRATGPFWTLIGAVLIFSERPTAVQSVGIGLALVGCWLFSLSTRREGVSFWRSRAIGYAFLGTFFGSGSALYDKCLLQRLGIPTVTVLWWFMGGMCAIYVIACLLRWRLSRVGGRMSSLLPVDRFEWRWTILLVGVLLAMSDACYFNAISMPDAKVSVLSLIRRSSVVLTFLAGGAVFRETNLRRKGIALVFILAGILLLCISR